MKTLQFMNPAHLFLEIGQDVLRAFNGMASAELPLERQPDGRLTDTCRATVISHLQRYIDHKSWQPRPRAFCAVHARGVSLRRLSLPPASREELHRLLPLQIESEFPLPPDQLAWGFQPLNQGGPRLASNGAQELLVAAVKKDSLEEYRNILTSCGAEPVFTLAALDRSYVCPQPPGSYAILHLEQTYSELITIESGAPVAVRVLSWGRENLSESAKRGGNGHGESVAPPASPEPATSFGGAIAQPKEEPAFSALAPLARMMKGLSIGPRIYVTGLERVPVDFDFARQLTGSVGNGVECQAVTLATGPVSSAAILGLQRSLEREPGWPSLVLQVKQTNGKAQIARQPLKWAAATMGLALLALLLPYAEALTLKSHLANKMAAIKTDQGRLAVLDSELDFLEYLKANEPPYLDALLVLAKAAPPGTRFDSVSMNRRGEVSLRGSLQNGQQVADLRSKLIDSGFFANVAIEEQSPTPDRQKVNLRMSAQWKPLESRTAPSVEPGWKSSAATGFPGSPMAGPPPGMSMPPGMSTPPGMRAPPGGSVAPGVSAPPADRAQAPRPPNTVLDKNPKN